MTLRIRYHRAIMKPAPALPNFGARPLPDVEKMDSCRMTPEMRSDLELLKLQILIKNFAMLPLVFRDAELKNFRAIRKSFLLVPKEGRNTVR